ncbi:MAG: thermonuclease family protein [Burkholderiaceae bacterium]
MTPILCIVLAVAEGDMLTARCEQQVLRVQVAAVDAPKATQPFADKSRQALSQLCLDEQAVLRIEGKGANGRTVAHVDCHGQNVSEFLVSRGLAWATGQNLGAAELKKLEEAARAAKVGLWADPAAMAPWEWRKSHGAKGTRS